MSFPVKNSYAEKWLSDHRIRRSISIRQSDRILTPLTYGIFRPVILMPKNTDWEKEDSLQYILAHEYVHIRRFDAAAKLILIAALCIHWFNPAVWLMYILANRDIELSCDETVIRLFGEKERAAYARTLISMEEEKSGFMPLCNNFGKDAIEERITAVMKTKKMTLGAVFVIIVLVIAVVTLFATSAEEENVSDDVRKQAEKLISQNYEAIKDSEYDYGYSDWRMNRLEHCYSYEDFDGKALEVYQLDYAFLSDEPQNVVLTGGMSMTEDGWVTPGYPNSTYLIFQRNGEELHYLTNLMENDCAPGEEIFTNDLAGALRLLGEETEEMRILSETEANDRQQDSAQVPEVTLSQKAAQYRNITYQQFQQQTDGEAEFYHATFFEAAIPGTRMNAIFGGKYDEEFAGTVLTGEDICLRLEGTLDSLLSGMTREMTPDELMSALAWNGEERPQYVLKEGAGTAYYVADHYISVEFDSDGDDIKDALLEISLDQSGKIGPDSRAWLY